VDFSPNKKNGPASGGLIGTLAGIVLGAAAIGIFRNSDVK